MDAQSQSTAWGERTSAARLAAARWYYAPLAYFLAVVTAKTWAASFSLAIDLFGFLVLALGANYALADRAKVPIIAEWSDRKTNAAQITADLLFFFVVFLASGGVDGVAASFFFLPIVAAIGIFGLRGTIVTALSSGGLVVLGVIMEHVALVPTSWGLARSSSAGYALSVDLTKALVLSVIFATVGTFGVMIARMLRERDDLLVTELAREEAQVRRLEALTKSLDESAKLLVRRDLELTSANEELVALDKMKSDIISVVGHQLRTPLAAVKWTIKMLLDGDGGPISAGGIELLSKAAEQTERTIILVNDVLSVEKMESGKVRYVFAPVHFDLLVEKVVEGLLPIAAKRGITIEFFAPSLGSLREVMGDSDRLSDAVMNLVHNAVKYSYDNGVVTVRLEEDGRIVHLSVEDRGIGIPEDARVKVFERFFRASNAVRAQSEGSGLGLFIAQQVARRHGGDLWFESTEGKGTTFHMTVPLS